MQSMVVAALSLLATGGGAVSSALAQVCVSWQPDQQSPTARNQHAMAFDSLRGVTVVFGGFAGGRNAETWEYNGTAWTQRNVAGPSARVQAGMAFDSARGQCVLFGGFNGAGASAETWVFDGAAWSLRPAPGPSARGRHVMAYDSARQRVVLFGGFNGSLRLDDTWEWNGTSWAQVAAPGPSARSTPSMTFDSARQRTVLFGGFDGSNLLSDTWEYNGAAWTSVPLTGPSARSLAAMNFDSARGVTVLVGGSTVNGDAGDTWEYNGAAWTLRAPSSISARQSAAMAFDAARSVSVLLGGSTDQILLGDTREWNGASWTLKTVSGPPPRREHAMAFDAARSTTVLFGGDVGGQILGDTWERIGTTWAERAVAGPPARTGHVMVFDAARAESLAFGGIGSNGLLADTWRWNGTAWVASAASGPSARRDAAATYDSQRSVVVLVGGLTDGGLSADTWEWNGTAWTLAAAVGPAARARHGLAYDSLRNRTVLFGGQTISGMSGETWEYNGSAWALSPATGPAPMVGARLAFDAGRGVIVLTGGQSATGSSSQAWDFDGTAWTLRTTAGPTQRFDHALAYDSSRSATVLFGGSVAGGVGGDTWEYVATSLPTITQPPAGVSVCLGQPITLTTAASGNGTITYHWRHNGSLLSDDAFISGSATPSLTISPARTIDIGSYDCVVAGPCGSVLTPSAGVQVGDAPTISQQPSSIERCAGQGASFTVAASGSGLAYQWRYNSQNLSNGGPISGANSATLSIASVAAGDAGLYDCIITGPCGNSTSNSASLTLSNGVSIGQNPTGTSVCDGSNASFTVGATGSGTLTYQWRRNTQNLTDGGAISGATTATLTITGAASGNQGSYDCVVTGACGSANSTAASLTVNASTQITGSPSPAQACVGQSASFSAAATGSGTLAYQWRRNSENLSNGGSISGATTPSLSINPIAQGDFGSYDCVVTGTCGSATSGAASLSAQSGVTIGSQPTPVTVCLGQPASFTVGATGEGLTYQWRRNNTNVSNGATISGATTPTLSISAIAPGDIGSYDCVVTGPCGSVASNAVALADAGVNISANPSPQTVCTAQPASFTVTASGSGTLTYQWRHNTQPLNDGAGITGSFTPTLSIAAAGLVDAGPYDCVITNTCGGVTTTAAQLTVNTAPSISQQPQPQTPCTGQGASFVVAATGSGTLAYQWRLNGLLLDDTTPYSGANTPTLTISAATATEAGSYDVVVSNSCGPITSAGASLSISPGPQITGQPQPLNRPSGSSAVFTVTLDNPTDATYQWRRNTQPLTSDARVAGATAATLTVSSLVSADAGSYDCLVTSSCGNSQSSAAALTVFCSADLDHDGTIAPADIAVFVQIWLGSLQNQTLDGDVDGNGAVEPSDVAVYVQRWLSQLTNGC